MIYLVIFMRDFSSFDIMLVHLKFQTYFVLPGLLSAIMPAEFSIKMRTYLTYVLLRAPDVLTIFISSMNELKYKFHVQT